MIWFSLFLAGWALTFLPAFRYFLDEVYVADSRDVFECAGLAFLVSVAWPVIVVAFIVRRLTQPHAEAVAERHNAKRRQA
jgi:hypothetical protein